MREVREWKVKRSERVYRHALFSLDEQELEAADGDRRRAVVLRPDDWVNVIAIDDDRRVLLIRQWRYGTAEVSLEIPGGVVEAGEEERTAAERELCEETGYRAHRWERLGEVAPNPAFQSNRCGFWLARDLERVGEAQGDGDEEISIEWESVDRLPELVARGNIRHSLVIGAFYFYDLYRRGSAGR